MRAPPVGAPLLHFVERARQRAERRAYAGTGQRTGAVRGNATVSAGPRASPGADLTPERSGRGDALRRREPIADELARPLMAR